MTIEELVYMIQHTKSLENQIHEEIKKSESNDTRLLDDILGTLGQLRSFIESIKLD